MKKLLFTYFLFTAILSFAQRPQLEKYEVSAKVLEANTKQPLEFATFIFTHLKSKKVFGGITNSTGIFSMQMPKGIYSVKVEFIGFETKNLPQQKIIKNTNLGTVFLSEDAEVLEEIEIIAEKSTVEIKLDKKIFNVGKDMTLKGGSASDVLDNVPSVNVDSEGTVSLRGNENVRILIDGKPSALVGLNGTDALANLPADAIEKVEVITSPSARYDAEGTAGILNVILRKGKVTGFNGSLGVTVGTPDQLNIAPNLNYRTKKINLFTNFGYAYQKGPGTADFKTTYFDDDENISSYTFQDRDDERDRKTYNALIGLEYYINKKSSITGSFAYQDSDKNGYSENIVTTGTTLTNLAYDTTRESFEGELENTKQYSLNYTTNFDDKGQKLIADLQYSDSYEKETTEIYDETIFTSESDQFTKSKNYLLQLDYILPFAKKSQLELGHKVDAQFLSANFDTTDNSGDIIEQVLVFDQIIYAYYAQYGNKADKISYLLGLRAETTDIDLSLESTNEIDSKKNYTKLFPTVNLGYEINENENLTLGFNRRISRPRSRFLNPFPSQNSSTFIFQGNPDLDPTFTNAVELGYNTKIRKLNLASSIYYKNAIDPITVVSRTIEDDTIEIRQPINIDSESRYGFELTTNYTPAKWLRLSGSFNYFGYKTDAFTFEYLDEGITKAVNLEEVTSTNWFTRFNANVTLPGKIQWQTRFMHKALQITAQTDRLPRYNTDIAFSKDILKDKATLTLSVKDLFNSRKFELLTYNEDRIDTESITELSFQRRMRQISLNFIYRFNQKKKRDKKRQQGGDGGAF